MENGPAQDGAVGNASDPAVIQVPADPVPSFHQEGSQPPDVDHIPSSVADLHGKAREGGLVEKKASLAGVPIFMPAIGYLLGASTVLKLAGNVGNQILNGHPVLSEKLQVDFLFGGGIPPQPGFWVFSSGTLEANMYQFDPTRGLIKRSNSSSYDGPDPVIVVSVDGTPVDDVTNFSPLRASASLLGRFFNQKDVSEVAMDSILQAAKLMNDLTYRKKAEDAKSKLDAPPTNSPDRTKLESALKAFNQNIGESRLQLN